eukprot:TRINITY_DN561_c0_g1_i1.p1 TRINITY_DN561_c0_g1~~TRINITY_DN561_c0_g1_i1.p1  ORF type:complete len:396 (+),score=94.09 TRINITY_DN561_c0_g1_i1:31-1188(+)
MPIKLKTIGRGGGGVEEMAGVIDPSTVQFGLVRFSFGSGTFKRDKFIFLHCNGEKCSVVRRGKLNSQRGSVEEALGATHASIEVANADNCNVDYFFDKLNKYFVSDNMSSSIGDLKEQYAKMIEEAKKAAEELERQKQALKDAKKKKGADGEAAPAEKKKRKTAADMDMDAPAAKVMEAIRDPKGPFNWALFEPNPKELKLVNAGSLSIMEMIDHVPEDQVVYGLLRLAFGTGTFRRTKWVFVHWIGPNTPPVKKGKASSVVGEMQEKLIHTVSVQLNDKSDLEPANFIATLKPKLVVDDLGGKSKKKDEEGQDEAFGLDQFLEALKEEQEETAEFFGDEGGDDADKKEEEPEEEGEKPEFDFDETVGLLRKGDETTNWAVFQTA